MIARQVVTWIPANGSVAKTLYQPYCQPVAYTENFH